MTVCAPVRAPTWFSSRRLLEQKLADLHKCNDLNHVKQVHAQILKADLHRDLYVAPKLIAALSVCRQLVSAISVFNLVHDPNVHLFNTLIRAHVQNNEFSRAFVVFFDMQSSGVYPDNFTYPFLLKACSGPAWLPVIEMIHAHVQKFGFDSDIFVPNSLIDSYSRCGLRGIASARKLFLSMDDRDIVSWNSMISGLVKAREINEARELFDEMPERDSVTWNTMLDGYVKAGEMNEAFKMFEKMPKRDIVSWSTMVLGFCKAGDVEMAKMLFDKMPIKNLVAWTIIISGYAQKGLAKEAISLYDQMEEAGLKPDGGTVISVLSACAESGLLGLGEKVHASIEKNRFKCNTEILNVLVDMYAKCGSLDTAYNVFNGMVKKDVVSWNAMLQGLAMHGNGDKALRLFSRMRKEGFLPDKATLIGVLCACTHAGLVEEGLHYFRTMERNYGIVPQVEHYGCVIDLLGRKGCLVEAFKIVNEMPMEPNSIIWSSLLGACRMHNDLELAKVALKHLITLDPSDPGYLSMFSNICAATGDWHGVADVRLRMRSTGMKKLSGSSSIEIDNEVHEFTVSDKIHPNSDSIYQMVHKLAQDIKELECDGKMCL